MYSCHYFVTKDMDVLSLGIRYITLSTPLWENCSSLNCINSLFLFDDLNYICSIVFFND